MLQKKLKGLKGKKRFVSQNLRLRVSCLRISTKNSYRLDWKKLNRNLKEGQRSVNLVMRIKSSECSAKLKKSNKQSRKQPKFVSKGFRNTRKN